MSTKCTIAFAHPPKSDFHLYFDYKDLEYHLDFYGENSSSTIIPKDAMEEILKAFAKRGFTLPGNLEYLEQKYEEKK